LDKRHVETQLLSGINVALGTVRMRVTEDRDNVDGMHTLLNVHITLINGVPDIA
jgi:hypothetical protein